MDRDTALGVLRLAADAQPEAIIAAYSRLARRYPSQQFPERHAQILEAKTALLNPELAFRAILFDEQIDVHWLNRYDDQAPQPAGHDASLQAAMEALFRPYLQQGSGVLLDESPSVIDSMKQFFSQFSEDELRGLMEKL